MHFKGMAFIKKAKEKSWHPLRSPGLGTLVLTGFLAFVAQVLPVPAEVTLDSDFTHTANQGEPLYNFWRVRNQIPSYPSPSARQLPAEYHSRNCIRMLGGWPTGPHTVGEDAAIWNEATQEYEYRLEKIIDRIEGVRTRGYDIHQIVLDNPPWCFQRGLKFSDNPGPGEYANELRNTTYGNSLPPGEPEAWHDFITAVMEKLVEVYGQELVSSWRFRVHTEGDFFPHHWAGTKMDFFEHYANTVDAVRAVVPGAKLGAHFLAPRANSGTYGPEFVTWCSENNVPYDFIGVSHYPFYNIRRWVDTDNTYDTTFRDFLEAPGWNPNAKLEMVEHALFTERDDDGFNIPVGTSHSDAFTVMLAKLLFDNSIAHLYNWGDRFSEPAFLALEGMVGKNRFPVERIGNPQQINNRIDGIFAASDTRQEIDAMVFNYNENPAYIANEPVKLTMDVPFPAGTTFQYRIAVSDRSNNPHSQFVDEYPLAGRWESEGGWVINRINPSSQNQTDKNGSLRDILVPEGRSLWLRERSKYPGYMSLLWSEWMTLTTVADGRGNSTVELSLPLSSFSFQKIELRTDAVPNSEVEGGLVAHWPLDEGSGTIAADASGFGSNGTLEGDSTAAPTMWGTDEIRGTHAVFNGTNQRISTPFSYALSSADDFTWAWWARSDLAASATTQRGAIMVGNRFGGGGEQTFEFIKFTPNEAQFANANTTGEIERISYSPIPQGGWNHYAMVKDGTAFKWYVNGIEGDMPLDAPINYSEATPLPFFIGGDSAANASEHFRGGIDDVVLYRRALSPVDVANLLSGIYDPTVTMVALGSPVDLASPATWADGLPPHADSRYLVPSSGILRSEIGNSSFPGIALTVAAGGRFQARGIEDASQVTRVDQLVLAGGSSFAPGNFAEVSAGFGTNATNVLDGTITNSGYSRFLTFGRVGSSTIARNLRVSSLISGSGRIQAVEQSAELLSSVFIDHPENSFSGTWEVAPGSSLIFAEEGATGSANIEVKGGGVLEIKGDWSSDAALAVATSAQTKVILASYAWEVASLTLGSIPVSDGIYTSAELNALASSPVFSGHGTITVGAGLPGGPIAHWKLNEDGGTGIAIDSSGRGNTGTLLPGASFITDPARGSVVSFDGSTGRITTPFTYRLSAGDHFTWAWWARADLASANGSIMVGNRFGGGGSETLEFIKFTPQRATFVNGGLADREDYDYQDITNNGWHHYAMVKTGTQYSWYVDGVLEQRSPSAPINYSETDSLPFHIGGDDDGVGRPGEHFRGAIDDVVLYDRSLNSAEILAVRRGGFYGLLPPATALQNWRERHFGIQGNQGNASDSSDVNSDGESNLLEFATGQDPNAGTSAEITAERVGANIEFRYVRSKEAEADGIGFTVEWSDTLLPGSWSTDGVTDLEDTQVPRSIDLEHRIATIPAGGAGKRFVHLRVTSPDGSR